MKIKFSSSWIKSSQPRKQRKYRFNAPLHIKQKFVSVHLDKLLREKHGKRSVVIRKGDNVKIMRGQFSKKTGKVEQVSLKKNQVFISGIEATKKDGTKVRYPINPSNLMITELNLEDKMRQKALKKK